MDLTAIEVERGLHEFFRSVKRGHDSSRISDVILLGSGYDADVFAFSLEAKGEKAELVLRLYAGERGEEKSGREFAALGRLRDAGYPVPQVMHRQGDRSPFGRPFVIMQRIHGASLGSSYWSATGKHRQELQAVLCRLMLQLHALDGRRILPESPLAGSREPYAFIDDQLSALSARVSRLEGRERASLCDALAWLHSRRSEVPCERFVVLHGDFHPNNLLLRTDGATLVIDWSNVQLGDYRSDLAWTRLLTRTDAQPDEDDAELRQYERLAGKAVSMIEVFEVVACVRLLSSVLISLQIGAAREAGTHVVGGRPGAEVLMRRYPGFTLSVAARLQRQTGIRMPDLEAARSSLLSPPGGTGARSR